MPTLAQWMGDALAKLPENWRSVLREQPVPAGMIERWDWRRARGGELYLWYTGRDGLDVPLHPCALADVAPIVLRDDDDQENLAALEAIQMGCFTRHPDAPPTPRPVQCWQPHDGDGAL